MNMISQKSAVGEAHSKIILFGEHAVVYGKSAIAIPFPLRIRTKINEIEGDTTITSLLYNGSLKDAPKEMNGLCECIKETFYILKRPCCNINLEFESEIPMGRGLGSSASAATSIVRALFEYFNESLSTDLLYHLVSLSECYAHGKPSGIDMMAVTSENPILFRKEKGAVDIKDDKEFYLVVADTGMIGGTRIAVEQVRQKQEENMERVNHVLNEINSITEEAREAIISGDSKKLGMLMNENHIRLVELGVSNQLLNHLVDNALENGALGAKLTGGGMGGCMISLAKNLDHGRLIGQALLQAGAKRTWHFSTKTQEIYKQI